MKGAEGGGRGKRGAAPCIRTVLGCFPGAAAEIVHVIPSLPSVFEPATASPGDTSTSGEKWLPWLADTYHDALFK